MSITRGELDRLASGMRAAGTVILACALAALIWPWPALTLARLGAGLAALLLGSWELSIAVAHHSRAAGRQLLLTQGASALVFALLTLALPLLPISVALDSVLLWLALTAGFALRGAAVTWPVRAVAGPLLAWGLVHAALVVVALRHPGATVLTMLFAGAAYAAALGAWLVVRGTLLRHRLRDADTAPPGARLVAELR